MLLFRSRQIALNSPLGHFNADNAYSSPPKYQTHETHGDSKVHFPPTATWLSLNYSEHNPSHARRHTLPSQPSQLLITQFRLNTHNLSTSLAAPKANPIFHAANKSIPKNTFRLSPYYFFKPVLYCFTNLARKQLNVNTHTLIPSPSLTNNKNLTLKYDL